MARTVVSLSTATLGELDGRIVVPRYDRSALSAGIVHIGVGGFHRAHLATYADDLAADGHREWAILGSGIMPADARMADVLSKQDCLYTLIVQDDEGTSVRVIGSIVDYVLAADDAEALVDRISDPATKIVSLTVTEGGYPVDEEAGVFDPARAASGPDSAFGVIVTALDRRRRDGLGALTVMSCDNVIGNGDVTRLAVLGVAEQVDSSLCDWIDRNATFPNGMVDRITPATTDRDRTLLSEEFGLTDGWPVVTEPFRQWVIEDAFAAGRPPWEDVGALVTSDVAPYEVMKLRLLNAGHSVIAYLAALLGYELVDRSVADPLLRDFLTAFLREEAAPSLPDIPGVDVDGYVRSVIDRFSNPAIGDQIPRLCQDGSAKIPKFLIPTVRAQLRRSGPIRWSALALAGWCRYLEGTADDGNPFEPAPDADLASARRQALRSQSDPEVFLEYSRVFDRDLAADPRLRSAFVDAIEDLRSRGVRSTLSGRLSGSPDEV